LIKLYKNDQSLQQKENTLKRMKEEGNLTSPAQFNGP